MKPLRLPVRPQRSAAVQGVRKAFHDARWLLPASGKNRGHVPRQLQYHLRLLGSSGSQVPIPTADLFQASGISLLAQRLQTADPTRVDATVGKRRTKRRETDLMMAQPRAPESRYIQRRDTLSAAVRAGNRGRVCSIQGGAGGPTASSNSRGARPQTTPRAHPHVQQAGRVPMGRFEGRTFRPLQRSGVNPPLLQRMPVEVGRDSTQIALRDGVTPPHKRKWCDRPVWGPLSSPR